MRDIINNSEGHIMNVKNFPNQKDFVCPVCVTEKLITRLFALKAKDEVPAFLDRI